MDPISMLDTNGTPLDAIEIKGIRCYGYTGYFRKNGFSASGSSWTSPSG